MCGRARLPTDYSEIKIKIRFDSAAQAPNLRPSWNIAPTQPMLTAIRPDPQRGRLPVPMHWGLIPSWSRDEKISYSTFNARAEGIEGKPTYRGAWKAGRRCLVITDGFYEWKRPEKQPFAIGRKGGNLTVMAGLWEEWTSPAKELIRSCTIITTEPNALMAPIHNRMPVILPEEDWPTWLGEFPADAATLKSLLRPYPGDDLSVWPIGKAVGNVRNDSPDLIRPVEIEH